MSTASVAVNPTSDSTVTGVRDHIQLAFERFHFDNPHVYRKLKQFALEVRSTGRTKYSIDGLFERLRWFYEIETQGGDPFKLNNNYRSRYARLLMANEPTLKGFFETRVTATERFERIN